ncbi:hypothetical protein H8356DRAFT_1035820 [Neocallimastix lanati (nom. inval.)]|nr:hypothetical protein H8356DRAFT_1035820 [Neocallimastix sp. JGI-2020a]
MSILNYSNPKLDIINSNDINNSKIINPLNYKNSCCSLNNIKAFNFSSKNNDKNITKNFFNIVNYPIKDSYLQQCINPQEYEHNVILPNEKEYLLNKNIKCSVYKDIDSISMQKLLSPNYNCKIELMSKDPETAFIYSQNYQSLNINNINNFVQNNIKNLYTISIDNEVVSPTNNDLFINSSEFKEENIYTNDYYNYNNSNNLNYTNEQLKTIKNENSCTNYLKINNNSKKAYNSISQCSIIDNNINNQNKKDTQKKEDIHDKNKIKKLFNMKITKKMTNKTKLSDTIIKKTISKKSKDDKPLLEKDNKFQYYVFLENKNNMESFCIKECSNCKTRVTPAWRRGKNDNLLCNACGLYEKQNNKSRPFKKLENGLIKVHKESISVKHVCANCKIEKTPTWRKGLNGQTLCNACGLFFKHHKSHRPCK